MKDDPFTPQWYAAEILERLYILRAFRFAGDVDNAILEGIRLGAALAEVESRSALDRRLRKDGRRGGRKRKSERDEVLVFKAQRLLTDRAKIDDPVESHTELARLVCEWYNRDVIPPESELSEARVRNILREHKVFP